MSTQIPSSNTFSQQVYEAKSAHNKEVDEPLGQTVSTLADKKNAVTKQLNAAILESALSLSVADSPEALVLKTALEGINDALSATLGDNAIQNAYDSGLDVSHEATAERIVSLSTAIFLFLPRAAS